MKITSMFKNVNAYFLLYVRYLLWYLNCIKISRMYTAIIFVVSLDQKTVHLECNNLYMTKAGVKPCVIRRQDFDESGCGVILLKRH